MASSRGRWLRWGLVLAALLTSASLLSVRVRRPLWRLAAERCPEDRRDDFISACAWDPSGSREAFLILGVGDTTTPSADNA